MSMNRSIPEPAEQKYVLWHNPTAFPVVYTPWVGSTDANPSGRVRITFAPGETKSVPAELAAGIHQLHEGMIVGGACPQLVNVGLSDAEQPTLHPALDVGAQKAKDAIVGIEEANRLQELVNQKLGKAGAAAVEAAKVSAKAADVADDLPGDAVPFELPKSKAPLSTPKGK